LARPVHPSQWAWLVFFFGIFFPILWIFGAFSGPAQGARPS
jgi:hypothetical protein